ncbi:ATP-binding protein [Carboxydothermus pertinax]|uniref:AAA+ ATPase domain-containing protein n=1 Tax=Carboxydothermus pertinax TaxID=870242 RepID=A0A1L8CRM8_9THEO|nr:ATP-binding protein [Carboxydothermus pertinax]GAV21585.1 hypothetical protein cpu_00950 [Carboxydothermus pertinax]
MAAEVKSLPQTTTHGISIEGMLAKKADEECPKCAGLEYCKMPQKGWRPVLHEEATKLYKIPTFAWASCRYFARQVAEEQKREYINERFEGKTFETYSVNFQNKQAFDKCFEYAQNFSWHTTEGLLLSGPVGTGKTHLAAAILKVVLERGIPGAMILVPKLLDEIRLAYHDETADRKLAEKVANKRFLVLDDIGAERTTDWVQEELFKLINTRYEKKLPTVLTTNCTIEELIEKLGERIVDRLVEMCEPVKIEGKSYRLQIRKDKKDKNRRK